MFASNLNSVVEMLGEDYHFEAVAYTNIYEEVENYDVILIAPQIGYLLKRLKESLPDKLVLQIPTAIFAGYDAIGAIKFIQNEINIVVWILYNTSVKSIEWHFYWSKVAQTGGPSGPLLKELTNRGIKVFFH